MNNDNKKISMAVVKRLPRYYRYLSDLLQNGVTRISSKELSEKMGVTASQIRQDLNCFGGFGQQGYGYNVQNLFNEVGKILGTDHRFNLIMIGLGNMGHALSNYQNFKKRGFDIVRIFDIRPELVGTKVNDIEVMHMDDLDDYIKNNPVDIAILTVPYNQTPAIADRLGKLGVRGLWNFSPMDLELPYDIEIENVHLSDSLMVLGYKIDSKKQK